MRALAITKCLPVLLGLGTILLPAISCSPVGRRDTISDMATKLKNLADTAQADASKLDDLLGAAAIGPNTQAVINDLNSIGNLTFATREAILDKGQPLPDATSSSLIIYGDSMIQAFSRMASVPTAARCVPLLGGQVVDALNDVKTGNEELFKAFVDNIDRGSPNSASLIASANAIQEDLGTTADLAIKNYDGSCIVSPL